MIVLLCAAASGAMFYLSQGLDDVWWLAWFAPAPLLWLAYGETRRRLLFLAALIAFACGQIYMVQTYLGAVPIWAMALMTCGMGSLFAAVLLFAQACWRKLPPAAASLAFPAAWTGIEYAISLVSPHGSWGALGYSQVGFPAAIQIASLFGLYAISFTLCFFASALALAVRGAWKAALPGFAVSALVLGFGAFHLQQPADETLRVAALADGEGHRRVVRRLDFSASRAMTESYAAVARQQAGRGVRFLVIPETALAADPAWRDRALEPLAKAARDKQLTIVTGVELVKPWRNAALSFLPDGTQKSYDKRHLLLPGEDKFTPGLKPGSLGDARSVAICKDLDFPRTLRGDAQAGIRLMAVPANDFVKDDWIHARMAVMRGVENGFAVVRAAFQGLETISDAQGRILARAPTSGRGMTVISADVALGPGPTLYTRIGDIFAWMCLVLTLALAAALVRSPSGEALRTRLSQA